MEKKSIIALVGALLVASIFAVGLTNAYRGDIAAKGPFYNEERHEAMENAFENNDYNAWKELMTENGRHPRVVDVVNEENFQRFSEIHEAIEEGNYELAEKIRAELGIGNGKRMNGYRANEHGFNGRMNGRFMGRNLRANFVDNNGNGICDNME